MLVRSNFRPVGNPQLRVISEWLDHASRWLEDEVRDNRQRDLVDGVSNSEQVVETLTFLRPELDRMVTGLRRAATMLVAIATPVSKSNLGPEPTIAAPRSRAHLRLVK
jgi:hypothetical protein